MVFRALVFAAVSSVAQAGEDRYSIPQQLELCREACARHGWAVAKEISVMGHSRNYLWLHQIVLDCPEYAELVGLVEREEIDLICARDFDRLFRTDALRAQLYALCREHRVQIFAVNQPVEPVDPALLGKGSDSSLIISAVSGVVSQLENESRKRRTTMGLRRRTDLGLPPGGYKAPYGYSRVDKHLIVNNAEAVWVRAVFAHRAEGWGIPRLVDWLNAQHIPAPCGGQWARSTLSGILRHPVYLGQVRRGEQHNPQGQHEALVSPELWERVRDVERAHQGRFPTYKGDPAHLLAGLVRCGYCGWSMSYITPHHGRTHALRCSQYAHTGGRVCRTNTVRAVELEGYVLYAVKAALDNPFAFAEEQRLDKVTDTSAELSALQSTHAANAAKWQRWDRLYEAGGIDANELLTHRLELQTAQAALQARITAIESAAQREASRHNHLVELAPLLDRFDALPPAELAAIYRSLIGHITVHADYPPAIEWL